MLGAAGWLWTAFGFMQQRQLMGLPYLRMLIILCAVALFTGASALSLEASSASPQLPPCLL